MSTPETRYTSIPQEEDEGHQSDDTRVSGNQANNPKGEGTGLYASLHNWWIHQWGNSNENAPLINRSKMTLEPPRKSNVRIAFEIVTIVGIFTLIGALTMLAVLGTNEVGGIVLLLPQP